MARIAPSKRTFVPFSKVEQLEDGTLIVKGVASTERADSDNEIVTSDAMRVAIPEWMKIGNIREMHQPIAAGVAIGANVDDNGTTHLETHIVDPGSVKKVLAEVLKGFSIGGRVTKRDPKNKKRILALKLSEISLVDRPANPDAMITMVKFDTDGRRLDDDEPVEKALIVPGKLRKGMYDIGILAELIASLNALTCWTQDEANWEGDNSPLAARMAAAVAMLCGVLRDMVDEETAEMLGITGEIVTTADMIAAAEKVGTLLKRGAKFSKTTRGALESVHKMLNDGRDMMEKGRDMMEKLGYADPANQQEDDDAMKSEDLKALQASVAALSDQITKASKGEAVTPPVVATVPPITTPDPVLAGMQTQITALTDLITKAVATVGEKDAEIAKLKGATEVLAKAVQDSGMLKRVARGNDGGPLAKADAVTAVTDDIEKGVAPKSGNTKAELKAALRAPLAGMTGIPAGASFGR